MEHENEILSYQMNKQDDAFAKLAEAIIKAYNCSQTPRVIRTGKPMYVKHTPEGYSLVTMLDGKIKATYKNFSDFIESIFELFSDVSVAWNDIVESKAVQKELQDKFGMNGIQVQKPCIHPEYGAGLICSTYSGNMWEDAYYCFDKGGKLSKMAEAC